MKIAIAIAISSLTLGFLWFSHAPDPVAHPAPEQGAANIFLQAGQEFLGVSSTQTEKLTNSPSITLVLSPLSVPSPTATQLIPQTTITASSAPTKTALPTPTPSLTQIPTPSPSVSGSPATSPSTTPQASLSITSLTNPVAQKQTANIELRTTPDSPCTIEVTWPSGSISISKDLAPKNADSNGIVSWSWGVNWNTKPGTATIKLSCTANGQTHSGETKMQIIASQ